MFRISELARQFGLSRSTLLYYDKVGLLSPSGRSGGDYRLYSAADRSRLEMICVYRRAGLGIGDIRTILAQGKDDASEVLGRRLKELGEEIQDLQAKQRLLAGMLKFSAAGGPQAEVDKKTWVAMLRAAGMDDQAMELWHAEFERRAPEAHHRFLISLGISEAEALLIRKVSAG
jgi:MerR family transcriptional regulator, thiopeptide resistance regulator